MTYVAKVSLPGYDVDTATPEQCVVHSSYPPLKSKTDQSPPHFALLDVDFTATVTQFVTHTVYSIPHNYGYIPFTIANIDFLTSVGTGSGHVIGLGYAGVGATLAIQAFCTTSNFVVTVYDEFNWTDASSRLLVSYYIFAENGS